MVSQSIQECIYDQECPKGQYCFDELSCTDCINCTKYFREFTNVDCPKNYDECGNCIIGKKEPSKYFEKGGKYCIDDEKYIVPINKIDSSDYDLSSTIIYIIVLISIIIGILVVFWCYKKKCKSPLKYAKKTFFCCKPRNPPTYIQTIEANRDPEKQTILPSAPHHNDDYNINIRGYSKEDEHFPKAGVCNLPEYVQPPLPGYGIPGLDESDGPIEEDTLESNWEPSAQLGNGESRLNFENILENQTTNEQRENAQHDNTQHDNAQHDSAFSLPEEDNNSTFTEFDSSESCTNENDERSLQIHNTNAMIIAQNQVEGSTYNSNQTNQNIIVNHLSFHNVNMFSEY